MKKETMLPLVNPEDSEVVLVPQSQYKTAMSHGFARPDQDTMKMFRDQRMAEQKVELGQEEERMKNEMAQTPGAKLETFARNMGSAASFGLTDRVSAAMDNQTMDQFNETTDRLNQQNPTQAIAGEITGALIDPSNLVGAGAATKVAKGAKMLGKSGGLATALGSAASGAVGGASEVARDAISGREVDLSDIALGAATGGALSGAATGAKKIGSKLKSKSDDIAGMFSKHDDAIEDLAQHTKRQKELPIEREEALLDATTKSDDYYAVKDQIDAEMDKFSEKFIPQIDTAKGRRAATAFLERKVGPLKTMLKKLEPDESASEAIKKKFKIEEMRLKNIADTMRELVEETNPAQKMGLETKLKMLAAAGSTGGTALAGMAASLHPTTNAIKEGIMKGVTGAATGGVKLSGKAMGAVGRKADAVGSRALGNLQTSTGQAGVAALAGAQNPEDRSAVTSHKMRDPKTGEVVEVTPELYNWYKEGLGYEEIFE